jgi:hypothetical protein
MNLVLPRSYFSYSQWSLWRRNKDQYRERYYRNQPLPETPEMVFGKKVARLLEDKRRLRRVKRYSHSEFKITLNLEGIPLMGYLDSFDPEKKRFMEFKTGHLRHNGTVPWNRVEVAKHDQLPFYSLLIKEKFGRMERTCHLVWLETKFKIKKTRFAGHELASESRELELTRRVEIFPRTIYQWEREQIKESIIKTAREVSLDYEKYRQSN